MRPLRSITLALLMSTPLPALADYAPPPDDHRYEPPPDYRRHEDEARQDEPPSAVHLYTGPALRVTDETARVGLRAAADLGAGPAGVRIAGSWVGTGADRGYSLYAGELFIDFGGARRLRPIIAAGAGLCRLEEVDAEDERRVQTLGVGVLRGTLQYRFDVVGVDARAGVDVAVEVPAFGAAEDTAPAWLTGAATVGVGF